ncbi:hypothetical protein BE15_23795 [Sorangium cellulosum]|uniref:Uncharacterized protein n=1 Tax=Sorangium cellulosum TaxID=56 RepID=A0A150QPE6_SORCE|nr:hypothetical protein BE15_23795 [Sorangium cellulosum]
MRGRPARWFAAISPSVRATSRSCEKYAGSRCSSSGSSGTSFNRSSVLTILPPCSASSAMRAKNAGYGSTYASGNSHVAPRVYDCLAYSRVPWRSSAQEPSWVFSRRRPHASVFVTPGSSPPSPSARAGESSRSAPSQRL